MEFNFQKLNNLSKVIYPENPNDKFWDSYELQILKGGDEMLKCEVIAIVNQKGGDGNIEYLVYMSNKINSNSTKEIVNVVNNAFKN